MCDIQSVGNRVGVAEPFLMRMAHGAPVPGQNWVRGKKNGPYSRLQKRDVPNNKILLSSEQTLRVAKRFYVALMLSRLVQVNVKPNKSPLPPFFFYFFIFNLALYLT